MGLEKESLTDRERPERASWEESQEFIQKIMSEGIKIDDLSLEIRAKYGLFEEIPIEEVD